MWDKGTADTGDDESDSDTATVTLAGGCVPTHVEHHPAISGSASCNPDKPVTYALRFEVNPDGATSIDGMPVDDLAYAGSFPVMGSDDVPLLGWPGRHGRVFGDGHGGVLHADAHTDADTAATTADADPDTYTDPDTHTIANAESEPDAVTTPAPPPDAGTSGESSARMDPKGRRSRARPKA